MGAHFEALKKGVQVAPFDSRYTQVGFNLNSAHVCLCVSGFCTASAARWQMKDEVADHDLFFCENGAVPLILLLAPDGTN